MFKSSITIAHVAGIPIQLHISFLLILPFLAFVIGNNIAAIAGMASMDVGQLTANPYLLGFIAAVLLFVSVVLHELAHSMVAMRQGIKIRAITLMLLGGVAQMDDDSTERDEIWMALAGPLFSLVFGVLLLWVLAPVLRSGSPEGYLVAFYLGFLNLFLAGFNMIPAFPSDGGRVLRSILARRMPYLQATRLATQIGRGFAILFAIFGFLSGNLLLILVAFFIYLGATQEYQHNVLRDVFERFKVQDLMTRAVATVTESTSVEELLQRMRVERHSGYPVVNEAGDLVGCVTLGDVRSLEADHPVLQSVGDIMSREVITVSPRDDLFAALRILSERDIGRLFVLDGENQLVGILTRSDIMKAYRLRALDEVSRDAH